jgi:hypothetical protein
MLLVSLIALLGEGGVSGRCPYLSDGMTRPFIASDEYERCFSGLRGSIRSRFDPAGVAAAPESRYPVALSLSRLTGIDEFYAG